MFEDKGLTHSKRKEIKNRLNSPEKIKTDTQSQLNKIKNKAALDYKTPDGKTTMDLRKFAAEASPEVEEINIKLAKAKAGKAVLEKKFDILIKSHHYYKDMALGYKKTIVGHANINPSREKIAEGWE